MQPLTCNAGLHGSAHRSLPLHISRHSQLTIKQQQLNNCCQQAAVLYRFRRQTVQCSSTDAPPTSNAGFENTTHRPSNDSQASVPSGFESELCQDNQNQLQQLQTGMIPDEIQLQQLMQQLEAGIADENELDDDSIVYSASKPGQPLDFDDFEVDDDFLIKELGFTPEEIEEQRAFAGAAFTDPEGIDLTFDETSNAQEDAPPQLRGAWLDSKMYGPEAVIVAGFPPEQLGIVRAVLDQAGGHDVKVLPVANADMLHGSVDEAIWAQEQDWSQPRSGLSVGIEGLAAWGTERVVLFSGLSIKAQATIVELLEGVGLGPLAAGMLIEDDGPRRLGDVLAEAVQAERKRRLLDKTAAARMQGSRATKATTHDTTNSDDDSKNTAQSPAGNQLMTGKLPKGMNSRIVDTLPDLLQLLAHKLAEDATTSQEVAAISATVQEATTTHAATLQDNVHTPDTQQQSQPAIDPLLASLAGQPIIKTQPVVSSSELSQATDTKGGLNKPTSQTQDASNGSAAAESSSTASTIAAASSELDKHKSSTKSSTASSQRDEELTAGSDLLEFENPLDDLLSGLDVIIPPSSSQPDSMATTAGSDISSSSPPTPSSQETHGTQREARVGSSGLSSSIPVQGSILGSIQEAMQRGVSPDELKQLIDAVYAQQQQQQQDTAAESAAVKVVASSKAPSEASIPSGKQQPMQPSSGLSPMPFSKPPFARDINNKPSSNMAPSSPRPESTEDQEAKRQAARQRVKALLAKSKSMAAARKQQPASMAGRTNNEDVTSSSQPSNGVSVSDKASQSVAIQSAPQTAYGPEPPPPPGSVAGNDNKAGMDLEGMFQMRPGAMRALQGKNVRFVDLSKLPSRYRKQMAEQAQKKRQQEQDNGTATPQDASNMQQAPADEYPGMDMDALDAAMAAANSSMPAGTKTSSRQTSRQNMQAHDNTTGSNVQSVGEDDAEEAQVRAWQKAMLQQRTSGLQEDSEEEDTSARDSAARGGLLGRRGGLHRRTRLQQQHANIDMDDEDEEVSRALNGRTTRSESMSMRQEVGQSAAHNERNVAGPGVSEAVDDVDDDEGSSSRVISASQLREICQAAQDQGLDPQIMMAEAMAVGVIITPQVAAAAGMQLPPKALVTAAKRRIERELAEAAEEEAARKRAGPKKRLGRVRTMTSGGRLRDLSVDIEEDGVEDLGEFEEQVFEDGSGGYVKMGRDGVLDIEASELPIDNLSKAQPSTAATNSVTSSTNTAKFKGFGRPPSSLRDAQEARTGSSSRQWGAGWAARAALAKQSQAAQQRQPRIEVIKSEPESTQRRGGAVSHRQVSGVASTAIERDARLKDGIPKQNQAKPTEQQ